MKASRYLGIGVALHISRAATPNKESTMKTNKKLELTKQTIKQLKTKTQIKAGYKSGAICQQTVQTCG
jgi:hypothetical protein